MWDKRAPRRLLLFAPVLLFLLNAGAVSAVESQPVASKNAYAIHRSIELDGDLGDWTGIPSYNNFLTNTRQPEMGQNPTRFMAAWDENYIYLAVIAEGQTEGEITAKNPPHTKVWWTDDAIEPYFWPSGNSVPSHYAFNPKGTKFTTESGKDDFEVITKIAPGRYTAEARFALNGQPLPRVKPGEEWKFRLGRENQADREYTIWPEGGDFSVVYYFGQLIFVESPAEAGAMPRPDGSGSAGAAGSQGAIKSPQGLKGIDRYTVYYGKDPEEIAKLSRFDLAIVDPGTLNPVQIKDLQAQGVIVLAYLSIGETAPDWYLNPLVDPSWILGVNETWKSKFIDASQNGWHELILNRAIPDIFVKGFNGLFFDTVDTAGAYPRIAPGMAALIKAIRGKYPDKVLVMNRGFAVLDEVAPSLDGVMYESLNSTIDWTTMVYQKAETDYRFLQDAMAKHGFVVLALDYAAPEQGDLIRHDYAEARRAGFIPYVSTIYLDRVYLHDAALTGD